MSYCVDALIFEVIQVSSSHAGGRDLYGGLVSQRQELAYRQLSATASEMPALFGYIDLKGPPNRLQIAKTEGYPAGPGMEPGKEGKRMYHSLDVSGDTARLPLQLLPGCAAL